MKKFYIKVITTVLFMWLTATGFAQVSGYTFNQENGTYVTIPESSGTLVDSAYYATVANSLDTKGWTIPLPFTFNFASTDFTELYANSNGGITFGSTTSSGTTLISTATNYQGALAVMNRDLWGYFLTQGSSTSGSNIITSVTDFYGVEVGKTIYGTGIAVGTTITAMDIPAGTITLSANATSTAAANALRIGTAELRTMVTGTAPNRTFIIEWKDFSDYTTTANTRSLLNFQVHLKETTNEVWFLYGLCSANLTTSRTNQVGLRGATNTDYNNRTSATDWAATTAGSSNAATVTRTNTINPASGLIFKWVPKTAAVDWCNLQWPPNGTITYGGEFNVYTQGYEPGVTEAAGAGTAITVWVGVSSTNTNPATWTTWIPATFNVQANNNDEFMANIGTGLGAGTWYYASRWQYDGGPFKYGGYTPEGGGFWDGTTNQSGMVTVTPAIANDICSGAVAIPCNGSVSGENNMATMDVLPGITCGSSTATTGTNNGLWFTVTPAFSGLTTVSTCAGTLFDTYIRVYQGGCGAFTACLGYDDDGCSESTYGLSQFSFTATAGITYYILMGGYGIDDTGSYTITATCPAACSAPVTSVSGITSTTATISWAQAGSYLLEYGAAGFTPGTGATAGAGGTIINPATSPQAITGLTASTAYDVYVRQDCNSTGNGYSGNSTLKTFTTLALPPANDEASGAIVLTVGAGCTGSIYTNLAATGSASEPFPSCSGTKVSPVWFSFVAPVSGAVRVSTDVTAGTFTDSKLAVFSAADVNDYNSFNIISCDDDGGSAIGSGFLSVVYANGLTPGSTYYIAVDKYSSGTASGSFCITVDELATSMLASSNTCGSSYQTPAGNSATTYSGWVPLMDASSRLVALVRNAAGGAVNSYTVAQNVNAGAVRQSVETNTYYLNRSFRINNASVTNVDVQLFFLDTELADLTAADGTTLAQVAVTKQVGTTCQPDFSFANGAIELLPQTNSGTANGVSWVQVTTPGFSNFYLHNGAKVLPISIQYFKGSKQSSGHLLDWKVSCTGAPSVTMELERSIDARHFTSIFAQSATATRCLQPFNYVDAAPASGLNYYRLKSIDIDGKVSYSSIVALLNKDKGFEIIGIAPNPVQDVAVMSISAAQKGIVEVMMTDLSGKQISKERLNVIAGNNQLSLKVATLPSGAYNVTVITADGERKTLRLLKD